MRALRRDEVRAIDAVAAGRFGLPTLVLMENAGRGAAEWLIPRLGTGHALVLCGPGNNGGDGGVVARWLDLAGATVRCVWYADPTRLAPDAAVQHRIVASAGIEPHDRPGPVDRAELERWLSAADWVVDGLLGTGLSRPVEGPLRQVIEALNAAGKPVLALDLPSGLDADTGQPLGLAVRATATVSFVAPKVGFAAPGASDWTGPVRVVPIGVPRRLLVEQGLLPPTATTTPATDPIG